MAQVSASMPPRRRSLRQPYSYYWVEAFEAFIMSLEILQSMPNLYIIAGCNGAGKTTASFTILPEMLNCKEFVNADSIAAGLSPFNPESVAIEAGRLMLSRIHELMEAEVDFAFETTLATRSYVSLVKKAQKAGYKVTLLFIWLDSPSTGIRRVAARVVKGGHNIPSDIIERRYYRGIYNLIDLYTPPSSTNIHPPK
jgi:predicted ABC-type ATPase